MQPQNQTIIPPPTPPAPVQIMEAIAPGDRPEQIDGARLYQVGQYLSLPNDQLPKQGDRICIEGIVRNAGSIMGASYVSLTLPDGDKWVPCEGLFTLDHLEFVVGTNVIVMGKQSNSSHRLSDTSVVKQSQIDRSLGLEKNPRPDAVEPTKPDCF